MRRGLRPNIHLVSFATPRYRPRQLVLNLSALGNRVVDTAVSWTPASLKRARFENTVPGIGLDERGSGFWAWKPFLISECLKRVAEGDFVLYCDVGRTFPYKQLDQPLDPFVRWMDKVRQDVMPGIEIPWNGPVVQWTKRDALVAMGMDDHAVHCTPPIQASFSVWRATSSSRHLASEWQALCSDRQLVSDDPSRFPEGEHAGFLEHRHDQALWSLLCRRRGIRAMSLGEAKPAFDEKNPSEVARYLAGARKASLAGRLIQPPVRILEGLERFLRPNAAS